VPSRRAVLTTLAVVALGGCAGETPSGENSTSPGTDTTRSVATSRRPTTAPGAPTESLDLQEANVVGVSVEPTGAGSRFSVTLQHDDDGEDGYANWWVVEALDGTELGRRPLAHPHGDEPFTRSTTVDVGDRSCVVVRGHDQTHGYGGRAAVVAVGSGAAEFVDQGPERRAIMAGTCP
jgi:hypothetical protein